MDESKIVDLLLRLLEKVSGLEAKVDGNNAMHTALETKVCAMEERIGALENAPSKKWNALTAAILAGIGTLIAGGVAAAVISALNK